MRKVLVLDTSIFCIWLQLPGFETCGSNDDSWDYKRVNEKIEEEIAANTTLILPLATIIETGNHISQCNGDRFNIAKAFCETLIKSVDNEEPWAAFSDQSELWSDDNIRELATNWPQLASQKISIGDATIKDVADFYATSGFEVEIFTGDAGLKAYQPSMPQKLTPRRKR